MSSKDTRILMGMPITVEIVGAFNYDKNIDKIFSYFHSIDNIFSTYKPDSEISLINKGIITKEDFSLEMKEIMALSEETSETTDGYFDIITPEGMYDPSGIVKGWAIKRASDILKEDGLTDFYIDAGGDIQTSGRNRKGGKWRVGIRNPFDNDQIVKVLELSGEGIATSGLYIRGDHIYNPKAYGLDIKNIPSITVVGVDVYEADRFATAAYAMGNSGVAFIESVGGIEGYVIDNRSVATLTSGFDRYTEK